MSPEQRLKAEDLLSTMYPEMIPTYLSFLEQTDPIPKLRFREEARQVSSTVWWTSLTGSKISEDFIELAIRLVRVSAPASSASIERIFSSFAHVHNKVRNSLSVEKAQKLVYCYRILRGNSTDYFNYFKQL